MPTRLAEGQCGGDQLRLLWRGERQCQRCLVPADVFYEWQKLDAKTKQLFAIALKSNEPYVFAGLWERWKDRQTGGDLLTFTIITTDPNEVVQPLHDKMPVIIPAKDYDRWLKLGDPARPPVDLLRPFDADQMTAWEVDRAVGNVKNDRPELIGLQSPQSRMRITLQKLRVFSSAHKAASP